MSIKEMSSRLAFKRVGSAAIGSNQGFTAFGAVIDTKDFPFDTTFIVGISAFTDGVYNLQVGEADDSGFTQNVGVLDREHLVGQPVLPIALTAALVAGVTNYQKLGFFASRRFARLEVEATGVTTGATLEAFIALGASVVPA